LTVTGGDDTAVTRSSSRQAVVPTINGAVTVEVSIDGITRGLVSLYNPTPITRTFDYDGLGVGPHVLQVRAANGTATVDAFITLPLPLR
jgi:hypothetical protein